MEIKTMASKDVFCDLSCRYKAKYRIRRITTGKWLNVCAIHDNYIGLENLRELGFSREEAKEIDRQVRQDGQKESK